MTAAAVVSRSASRVDGSSSTSSWTTRRLYTPRCPSSAEEPALFSDDDVRLDLLRQRAFNLRWATVPADVIPLTAADPDFPVAPAIREAISRHALEGVFSYAPAEGLPAFRNTVASGLLDRRGLAIDPNQVFPTNSAASAMFLAAALVLAPGDEVVVFDPVDFLFAASAEAAGATVVRCPLDEQGRFDAGELASLITPRTRMLTLCSPHNPLGHVLQRAELEAFAALAEQHDLWILSDEVWSDIVYPPHQHISTASLAPEIARRTFTVLGWSKTFGLAGLRAGALILPSVAHRDQVLGLSGAAATAYGVSTLTQVAAVAAWQDGWPWVEGFLAHLQGMRDLAVERLNRLDGVTARAPQGTYVVFPDVSAKDPDASALVQRILTQARVALVPGAPRWFGPRAAGHMRLCFSTSRGILTQALDRIEEAWPRV